MNELRFSEHQLTSKCRKHQTSKKLILRLRRLEYGANLWSDRSQNGKKYPRSLSYKVKQNMYMPRFHIEFQLPLIKCHRKFSRVDSITWEVSKQKKIKCLFFRNASNDLLVLYRSVKLGKPFWHLQFFKKTTRKFDDFLPLILKWSNQKYKAHYYWLEAS